MSNAAKKLLIANVVGVLIIALYCFLNLNEHFKFLSNCIGGFCVGLTAFRFSTWTAERWISDGHGKTDQASDSESEEEGNSDS